MKSVCVYCGSRSGNDPVYETAATELGTLLAQTNRTLVYGGGNIGLMGTLADAALAAGGRVIGVIPRSLLAKEVGHPGLTELHIVETMHDRKAMMADLADGFVTMPGGIGTLEEFFETWTWGQLRIHTKPYAIWNVAGFYDSLISFLQQTVHAGFLKPDHYQSLHIGTDPRTLLEHMQTTPTPEAIAKWDAPR